MILCPRCGEQLLRGTAHVCEAAPTLPPRAKDSLDNSEPPQAEEAGFHTFVSRMEYRADRRETREWRVGNEARLSRIEKRLTIVGLAIAAVTAATNGTVPWDKIVQALGW